MTAKIEIHKIVVSAIQAFTRGENMFVAATNAADAILAQVEAPEDAEVAAIEKRQAVRREILLNPLSSEHRDMPQPSSIDDCDALLAKLRARTSQAEAQAPAVLTPLDVAARKLYTDYCDNAGIHSNRFPSWGELSEVARAEWRVKASAK